MNSEINVTRKFGLEIEVLIPIVGRGEQRDVQDLLAEIMTHQGIPSCSRSYSHEPLPTDCLLAIEHDSSLQDESRYQGLRWSKIEAKTCPMTFEVFEQVVPAALDVIRYVGARCNISTGLHVHHHLPEVAENPQVVRNLQHLWWRFHQVLYGLVAPSRKQRHYCRPPTQDEAKVFDGVNSYERLVWLLQRSDRYQGLNLKNLADPERMTVEWRLHGGSADWTKIRAWVLATQRWVEHAVARSCHYKPEPTPNTQTGLNALLVATGLKSNSRIYNRVQKELRDVGKILLRRWKHFNRPGEYKGKAAAAAA